MTASSTARVYGVAWSRFESWCAEHAVSALPAAPETLVGYLTDLVTEGYAWNTVQTYAAVISSRHAEQGLPNPRHAYWVRQALTALHKVAANKNPEQAVPLTVDNLRQIVTLMDLKDAVDLRDRALLLVGFAGALRRSELVALLVSDVDWSSDGMLLHVRRSKTDQSGVGARVRIPIAQDPSLCPVAALRAWLALYRTPRPNMPLLGRFTGTCATPTYKSLSAEGANRVVKKWVQRIGLNPSDYSANSLRAGYAIAADAQGTPLGAIMAHTRHASANGVEPYIRPQQRAGLSDGNGLL